MQLCTAQWGLIVRTAALMPCTKGTLEPSYLTPQQPSRDLRPLVIPCTCRSPPCTHTSQSVAGLYGLSEGPQGPAGCDAEVEGAGLTWHVASRDRLPLDILALVGDD